MTPRGSVADLPSLASSLVQWIAGGIIDGRWAPNERLNEVHIAEELGVSRAPVREALRILSEQGMVTHLPRVGSVANSFTPQTVADVYNLRCVIERWYAAESVGYLTEKARKDLVTILGILEETFDGSDYRRFYSEAWKVREVLYGCHPNSLALGEIRRLRARLHTLPNVLNSLPEMARWARDRHRQLVEAAIAGRSDEVAGLIVELLIRSRDEVKAAYETRLNSRTDERANPARPVSSHRIDRGYARGTDQYPTR